MRRITVNTCLSQLRSRKLTNDLDEGYDDETDAPDGLSDLNYQQLLELVQQLPDGYRAVFNLYAIEGYDHKEIAKELGITDSTSRSQLAKARRMLKEKYERTYNIPDYAKQA